MKNLWNKLPDTVKRALHTFWQAFIAVFLLGVTEVISNLINTGDIHAAKAALIALVVAALSAALSAVKSLLVKGSK